MFAYEQCLLCLGHHPDVWYEAALYLENSSKNFAEKGVRRINYCLILFENMFEKNNKCPAC